MLALFGTFVLAHHSSSTQQLTTVIIYGVMLVLAMGTSTAYNRMRSRPAVTPAFRRADRAAIFGLIAGTYTPLLGALDRTWTWILLALVWIVAILGAIAMLVWNNLPRLAGTALYLVLGWVFVAFVPAMAHRFGPTPAALLIFGGVLYSLGAIVYATRTPNPSPRWFGYHEVFHLFVVAAATTHFAAVYLTT